MTDFYVDTVLAAEQDQADNEAAKFNRLVDDLVETATLREENRIGHRMTNEIRNGFRLGYLAAISGHMETIIGL